MVRRLGFLAVLLLLLGGGERAAAELQIYCSEIATPAQVKAQGTAEPLGDILILCNASRYPPAPTELQIDIQVTLNSTLANADLGNGITSAVLTVNENECETPAATGGTYSSCGAPDSRFQDPQSGLKTANNTLKWKSVRFPVPGAPATGGAGCSDCYPIITVLRLTGIRSTVPEAEVVASLSITGSQELYFLNKKLVVGRASDTVGGDYGNASPGESGTASCGLSAGVPPLDSAGTTERLGSILLDCSNFTHPSFIPQPQGLLFDLVLELNVDFTGPTSIEPDGTVLTEVTLTIDGDQAGAYLAELESPRKIRFREVALPFSVDHPLAKAVIDNLIADSSQVMAVPAPGMATALVSVSGSRALAMSVSELNVGVLGDEPFDVSHDLAIPLECGVNATPLVLRAQAITSLQADIVLTCIHSGLLPGDNPTFTADLFLDLNVDVTNNIGFSGADLTDAVLVVNENNCFSPAAAGSTFGSCGAPFPEMQDPQYGRLISPHRIVWEDVAVPVPGFDPDGGGPATAYPLVTTLRLTGVRGNSSQLGIPSVPSFPRAEVTASLTVGGTASLALRTNVLDTGLPLLGMITSLSPGPVVAQQCRSGEGQTAIRLNEAFTNAFKLEGSPDFVSYNAQWESGYYAPGSNNGGGASQATRFLLRFVNVPSGVQVDLPRHVDTGSDPAVTGDALELRLLEGTDERGAGGALVAGEGLQSVALSSGTGSAVYEVVDEDPFRLDTIDIPISVSWTSDTANGMPGLGDARVIATLAPLSTVLEASGPEPEPRFVDNGGEGLVFFSSVPCTTTLLFSTVSNQQGSDTRIAIANTSGLSAGGEGEAGACTVHYHGAMEGGGAAPSDQTSVILQPGEQLDFTLSGGSIAQGIPGAPGFAGYVMAECEFDGAVGRSNQAAQQVEIETAPETVLRDAQRVRQSQTLGLVLDFVSDRNDLDTEISVINTTEDWFGTQLESGQCFVKLGSTGFQTPEILGGETYTFQVSSISPGFEGMVSIDCAFAEARAFAKVTRTPTPGQPAPQAFGLTAERRPAAAGSSTQLLLPHIDSRNRLHSWLVVTNTSVGLGASTPTGGTCTLSYLGDAGSPTIAPQTLALAAGEQVRFRLSEGLPAKGIASASDFFGSLALSCDFPLARATALSFEGTGGRSRASFAQQAEVISAPRSTLVHSVTFPGLADTAQRQPIVTLTNTTLDVFGTTPQAGSCLLDYRGTAPGGVPSPTAVSLAAGERLRFAISEGLAAKGVPAAPGFVGFLVATCDFPLARGLQFRRKAVTPLQLSQRPGVYLDGEWRLDVDGDAVFNPAVDKRIFLGFPGATPVVGDWNGDGRDDVGVYAGGFWFLDFDGDANWDGGVNDKLFAYGFAGAEPVVGDWNGDGRDDVGVYAKGFWFLDANGDQLWDGGVQDTLFGLGWPGVTTLVGDWNGDGRDKVGVYALGFWFLDYDGDANWDGGVVDRQFGWGGWSGIKPIPGDWNGDGRDQAAVAPVNQTGSWFVDYDGDAQYGPADRSIPLGFSGTEPVPGDWNGDGRMTPGIVNAKTFWFPDVNGDYLWAQPGDPIWTWGLGSLNSVIFPGRW